MMQAIRSTRPGGSVGFIGVPHDALLDLQPVFFTLSRLHSSPAPVRRYLANLINLVPRRNYLASIREDGKGLLRRKSPIRFLILSLR